MRGWLLAVAIIAFASISSSSSASWIPARRGVSFDEREFARYSASGSGTVEGQIVIRGEDDGQRHVGSGSDLTLLPVTPYTTEMVDREIRNGENLTSSDTRLRKYLRATKADGNGSFAFRHVPSGEYYLTGLVSWYFGEDTYYQWACEKITVREGQTVRLTVSRNVHRAGRPYVVFWRLE